MIATESDVMIKDEHKPNTFSFLSTPTFGLRDPIKATKVWSGFGMPTFAPAIGGVVRCRQNPPIDTNVPRIVELEQPCELAVLEIEINAGSTRAALDDVRALGA